MADASTKADGASQPNGELALQILHGGGGGFIHYIGDTLTVRLGSDGTLRAKLVGVTAYGNRSSTSDIDIPDDDLKVLRDLMDRIAEKHRSRLEVLSVTHAAESLVAASRAGEPL